jgi:hypothetical protein
MRRLLEIGRRERSRRLSRTSFGGANEQPVVLELRTWQFNGAFVVTGQTEGNRDQKVFRAVQNQPGRLELSF